MIKKFLKFSKSPILLYSSYLITLISFILAIYFYLETKKEREPFFISSNYNEPILKNYKIDTEDDLDFKIILKTDRGKNQIKGNIYSSKIYFWNNGKESIKSENILQNLIIYPEKKSKILSVRILKETRPEITKFSVDLNNEQNEINLSFNILEQNDGVTIQVIYNGDESEKLLLRGTIESVKEIKISNKFSEPISISLAVVYTTIGLILLGILLVILILLLNKLFIKFYQLLYSLTKLEFFRNQLQKEKDDLGRSMNFLAILAVIYVIYFSAKTLSLNSNDIPKEIIIEKINGV
ncbi:hypothetical protein [Leptospira levettii]|uniref:Uncharacterized protein n=1 Tax=Leptospira levettii TaxID=2023178 RepID=A0AAW5V9N9_9LEPT|nr:hypothetical protein [Leptospira levettii]MCW7467821.1 hypothetical protein [Leptospira levettii]MCW7513452.1 hypothetical protein [Leptospira levettii]MCW7517215.1 hypothetical protein [Leptospira levettii]PKA22570.1 hypothetical protein CH381_30180 [Leptospira sp. mixed culture ATI2-C-A1]